MYYVCSQNIVQISISHSKSKEWYLQKNLLVILPLEVIKKIKVFDGFNL